MIGVAIGVYKYGMYKYGNHLTPGLAEVSASGCGLGSRTSASDRSARRRSTSATRASSTHYSGLRPGGMWSHTRRSARSWEGFIVQQIMHLLRAPQRQCFHWSTDTGRETRPARHGRRAPLRVRGQAGGGAQAHPVDAFGARDAEPGPSGRGSRRDGALPAGPECARASRGGTRRNTGLPSRQVTRRPMATRALQERWTLDASTV